MTSRGALVRLLGLAGNVVLARYLLPHDYGLVALGLSIVMFVSFVTDAGFAAVLIRRAESPLRDELRALIAAPLLGTVVLATCLAASALVFGEAAGLAALMCAGLTVRTFRGPGNVLLERDLRFSAIVLVETVDALAFYAWTIPMLAAGWGVWAPGSAVLVQNLICVAVVWRIVPRARLLPRWGWATIRRIWRAGLAFQGVSWAVLVRDQLLLLTIGATGGAAAIGLWTVSYRILQVPFLLLESLWRISYPAMQRIIALKEDTGPLVRRALRVSATGTGCTVAVLIGSAPGLVPALFGPQWHDSVEILIPAAVGVLVSSPLASVASALLYALGDFRYVVQSVVLQGTVTVALAVSLYPLLGIVSVGVGWLAGSIGESVVLASALRRRTGPVAARCAGPSTVRGLVASAAGLAASQGASDVWLSGLLGGVTALIVFLVSCLVGERESLRSCASVLRLARAAVH